MQIHILQLPPLSTPQPLYISLYRKEKPLLSCMKGRESEQLSSNVSGTAHRQVLQITMTNDYFKLLA